MSSSRPRDQRVASLNAPASAPVASVKAKCGGGASPSSAIGQNGMQLRIPLAMVVRIAGRIVGSDKMGLIQSRLRIVGREQRENLLSTILHPEAVP